MAWRPASKRNISEMAMKAAICHGVGSQIGGRNVGGGCIIGIENIEMAAQYHRLAASQWRRKQPES